MTEREKMLAGELYFAGDPELVRMRDAAQAACLAFNALGTADRAALDVAMRRIVRNAGAGTYIQPPFYCDYGDHISIGANTYLNWNCVILDCAPVTIGSFAKFGPGVQLFAATHPIDPVVRKSGLEFAKPIRIGDNAWIGGGTVICPGVTIGEDAVIGAGSVVARDIPARCVAVGNPCRVMRKL